MSKREKNYDATVARMVGNMLSGVPDVWNVHTGDKWAQEKLLDAEHRAILVARRVVKALAED